MNQSLHTVPRVRVLPRLRLLQLLALGGLLVWAIIVCVPLLIMILGALKAPTEFFTNPLTLPQSFQWANFVQAWNQAQLGQALFNTVLITACSVAALVVFGSMAAYPLARRAGATYRYLYLYFIAGVLLPVGLSILPLYKLMNDLQLINTYQGIILLYTAGSLPFTIFLYTGFMRALPRELEEAAFVDGASPLRVFWTIVFPLLKPVTATVIIITSLNIWNDFYLPLLFLQTSNNQTLSLAIYTFVSSFSTNQWNLEFASLIISIMPLVLAFLFLQRYFIKGLTSGAVRG